MLTLTIPDKDITNGSIPISWCLDHESIKELMDAGNTNPTILIVVAPQNGYHIKKEVRYVCALSELMTYISFIRPGENRIFALIFQSSVSSIKDSELSKHKGEYNSRILRHDGTAIYNYDDYIKTSLDVDVPADIFAKEPSDWEKNWVLWLVKDKGMDQCDFRRKRLFAYTVQPFIMLGNILLRFLFTFLSASLLLKSFTFKCLLHPMSTDFEDLNDLVSGRMFFYKPIEKFYSEESPEKFLAHIRDMLLIAKLVVPILFTPLILLFLIPLIYFGGTTAIMAVLVSILIVGFIASITMWLMVKLKNLTNKEENPKIKDLLKEEIDFLLCNSNYNFTKISSLPPKKRSIKLRFQQIKSKICRPFPG